MKKIIWLPLTLIVVFNLTGCTLLQPTDPYIPVSGLTATALNHPMNPQLSPQELNIIEGPLTLEKALEVALANNPELTAVQWDVSAAASRIEETRAIRWPNVSALGGYRNYLDDQRLIPTRYQGEIGIFDDRISRGDLLVKMPLFTGGRITNEISAAELLGKAEKNKLSRTRQELIFNVSSTFNSILGQRKVIESVKFSIKAMQQHLKQVSDMLDAQKAAKVDLLRTEVRLADLQQSLVRQQNILAVQKRVLITLLGLNDDRQSPTIEGELSFEVLPPLNPSELFPVAFDKRNDYLAAKDKLEAQARRVDVARARHWPTVSVLGAYGVRRAESLDESEDTGFIGVEATIPLFEGGGTAARVNKERAALAAAQQRLRRLKLQIRKEVETAILDLRSSGERIKATQQAVEQAKESMRIERLKYDLGKGSITDVLDAQSALLRTDTNYYQALADFRTSLARFNFAMGVKIL